MSFLYFILLHQLLDQMPGPVWVAVGHHGLDHAAHGDTGGLDVAAAHFLPATPHLGEEH